MVSPKANYPNSFYIECIKPIVKNINNIDLYQTTKFMIEFNTQIFTYWKDDITGT